LSPNSAYNATRVELPSKPTSPPHLVSYVMRWDTPWPVVQFPGPAQRDV